MFDHVETQGLDVHSILILRNDHLVLEAYFYPYDGDESRHTYSCTKSITSALIGIAIEKGYIEGLDAKVLDFFSERAIANDGPWKRAMAIEHLLTMTSGLDWPESSVPYGPGNILASMLASRDWVGFVLDRPMAAEPGTTFNYNTGASHLLSAILEEATGMNTWAFARLYLFNHLNVDSRDVYWRADPQGVSFGGGGLHMKPRDMLKFGLLYLRGGVWGYRQVVPVGWVTASVDAPGYGHQWWMLAGGGYAALGYRGQRIVVVPDLEMVVVITGEFSGTASRHLVDAFILPAVRSVEPLPENPAALAALEERVRLAAGPQE
jgi:CubicO group peptidase (beta-lactamase class C family)